MKFVEEMKEISEKIHEQNKANYQKKRKEQKELEMLEIKQAIIAAANKGYGAVWLYISFMEQAKKWAESEHITWQQSKEEKYAQLCFRWYADGPCCYDFVKAK